MAGGEGGGPTNHKAWKLTASRFLVCLRVAENSSAANRFKRQTCGWGNLKDSTLISVAKDKDKVCISFIEF